MRVSVVGMEPERTRIVAALMRGGLTVVADGADTVLTVAAPPLAWAGISIDLPQRRATRDGVPLSLTRIEWAILATLADGQAKPRAALLTAVWGYRFDPGTNALAVHVHRLRAKIGRQAIVADGDGYRLGVDRSKPDPLGS